MIRESYKPFSKEVAPEKEGVGAGSLKMICKLRHDP